MPALKVIAKNITANYAGVLGHMLVAFFISPFLVHTLGDSKYGIWTIIAALSGYMSLLDLGIASALTRYVARHYRRDEVEVVNGFINSTLFLFLLIAVLLILVSWSASGLIVQLIAVDPEIKNILGTLIILVSVDVGLFVISGVFRGAFGGLQRFDIVNIASFSSALFKAISFYIFLSHGYGLISMAVITIAASTLLIAFYYLALTRYYSFLKFSTSYIKKSHILSVFHFSKYIFLAMLTAQLLSYSSPIIIGYFMGAASVTYYSIPWTLAEYVKQLNIAVSRTFTPVFSELDSDDNRTALYATYLSSSRIMLVLSNLFCVGMIVMGSSFIDIWMGTKYGMIAEPLIWVMFVTLYFVGPQLVGQSLLQGMAINKVYAYSTIAVAVISIILVVSLVGAYGLLGVAVGAAIPQVLYGGGFLPWFISNRIFKFSYWDYLLKTHVRMFAPALILYGLLSLTKHIVPIDSYASLLSQAAFGTLVYLFFVYFLSLDTWERQRFRIYLSDKVSRQL